MKFTKADLAAVRNRSFRSWQEIAAAVAERREHIKGLIEERADWRKVQLIVGMEE